MASARLDALVKIVTRLSREEAARRIESGTVSLDHMPCLSVSQPVKEGAVLSVRGYGWFLIAQIGPTTKKGRLLITIKQYL